MEQTNRKPWEILTVYICKLNTQLTMTMEISCVLE